MNNLFLVVLGLSMLVDLALGAWAGANLPHFAKTFGLDGVARGTAGHLFGWVLATCLVCFAAVQGLAFRWARRDKEEGPQLAVLFGGWLVLSSVATFAFTRMQGPNAAFVDMGWKFLVLDGLRGALLAGLGFLALRAPSVVRELRLPERARQSPRREDRPERPRHERGRERTPRRGGGREGGRGEARSRRDEDRPAARERGERRGGRGGEGRREGRGRDERRRDGRRREERAPISADLESRAVAEARRISPEAAERPLTVVVKGAPERIRALAPPDDVRAVEDPTDHLPVDGTMEDEADPGRRRRRRRRRRGGGGEAADTYDDDSVSAGPGDLEEPVVVEREFSDSFGEDSGEDQAGASGVRGRRRRRRRRPGSGESAAEGSDSFENGPEQGREYPRASAAEALDALRLLEPETPRSSTPGPSADRAYGRTRRPAGNRSGGAPRRSGDE